MVKYAKDIFKFLRIILMVLAVVMSLSACSSGGAITNDGHEAELDEQQRACWQSEVLAMFYNAMATSSLKAYPKVTESAFPFMMVAFALWLSIRLLKHVGSVQAESPSEVWTEITRMMFLCFVCGLMASSTSLLLFALNKLILPIYYAFLEYGSLALDTLSKGGDVNAQGLIIGSGENETCLIYTNSIICQAPPLEQIKLENGIGAFPSGPSDLMQCLVCATSDRMQVGFALARNLMGMGNFSSVIGGIIIFAIFTIVKISFVFYLIDSIFRMNIMVILLPCLIIAYPFKFSRKWTKSGFLMMINSAAIMMCIAIMASMAMLAMQMVLTDNAAAFGERRLYEEFGVLTLSLILIAFLVLKSISLAVMMASSLVGGGGGTNFQKKIAALAAFVAKSLASWITGGAAKMFMKSPAAQKVQERIAQAKENFNKLAGRGGDEDK